MKRQKKPRKDFNKEELLLSLERTVLSKERTVLAEITVLLGFMALGILVVRLFEDQSMLLFGFALVVFSIIAMFYLIYNFRKHAKELKKIEKTGSVKLPEFD